MDYSELTFTNNFVFCKVLENNLDLCGQLLELILGVAIERVELADKEKVLDITPDGKSVRLDIYVEDDVSTVYNIEMQVAPKRNLPKRSRYYQGMIDLNSIEKGARYNVLKKSYVIFVCMFDPFKENLPVYTFTNRCKEMLELELGDV
ncbi:MAG: Rpn family recombination-promoting nuclease/putative transposase [Lachnospiraceae bacterium]|nr:Rpn family recombination-promoting nuclease/putative transposase [Lachnospiraceae bacterium]